MKVAYIPMFRMATSYTVSFGRRWSLLEQLLLVELGNARGTVRDLSSATNMPDRLVIEALINLLRANWIEVRASSTGVVFATTPAGKRRAGEEQLPAKLERGTRWISLCVDRLTGAWLRAEDLELVYERDLPEDATLMEARLSTFNPLDGSMRDLLYLKFDENLEPVEPVYRNPSRPYARVTVAFGQIEGLPSYAPISLQRAILDAVGETTAAKEAPKAAKLGEEYGPSMDDVDEQDIIVGGPAHRQLLRDCLDRASSHIIIHSCFLNAEVVASLLPDFQRAAQRKVRIDLLWGLHRDPEAANNPPAVSDVNRALDNLAPEARSRVQMSTVSSGSHVKAILYDDRRLHKWITVLGSCNFLSSWFNSIDVSVTLESQRFAAQVLSRLVAAQLPASGSWSPIARRLHNSWNAVRKRTSASEKGLHLLTLIEDTDHYACVTDARDQATDRIVIGCDIWGIASETSVLVPMESASKLGRRVLLLYQRPSRLMVEQNKEPTPEALRRRGIEVEQVRSLHGKFLLADSDRLLVTSFNWMSTITDDTRLRGGELGVAIRGGNIANLFQAKYEQETGQSIDKIPS